MLPAMHNGFPWGMGLAYPAPNLDVIFSGLELDVRNTVDEIKDLDNGIESLEKELEAALLERDSALRALANANQDLMESTLIDSQVQLLDQAAPPTASAALVTTGATSSQLEQPMLTEVQPHSGSGEAQHGQDGDDQAMQLTQAIDERPDELTRPSEDGISPRDATAIIAASPATLPSEPSHRDDTAMEEASLSRGPSPSPQLSAEDIRNRLVEVLRHLRDTAACCRQIPDLDRGFSNLLKSTYKTLFDSLKGSTAKGATGGRGPNTATASGAATAGPSRRPSAAARAGAGAALAMDSPGTGASAEASGASGAPRDLSVLARAVHAKRLRQQADGGGAARDADQPPARRPARSSTPSATSAGFRPSKLYDGLPPARVLPGAGAPGQATATDAAAAVEAGAQAAEPQPEPPQEPAAAAGQREATGNEPAPSSSHQDISTVEQTPILGATTHQQQQPHCAGDCVGGADDAGGDCGGSGQAEAALPSCGGSPSQQLLEQARASGRGLARSLLMQTAQVPAGSEALSPSEGSPPDRSPEGGRQQQQQDREQATRESTGTEEGGGQQQQRAKRALVLEPIAPGLGSGLDASSSSLEVAAAVAAAAPASKRQHTGS